MHRCRFVEMSSSQSEQVCVLWLKSNELSRSLSQGGDRKKWIASDGCWKHRTVANVQALMDSVLAGRVVNIPSANRIVNLASVIDDTTSRVVAHSATTERMDRDHLVSKHF